MSSSEALFGELLYGVMDVQEPTGWMRLQAVLAIPDEEDRGIHVVRCLDVSAKDEAGAEIELSEAEAHHFGQRFVEAFHRRGKRVHKG